MLNEEDSKVQERIACRALELESKKLSTLELFKEALNIFLTLDALAQNFPNPEEWLKNHPIVQFLAFRIKFATYGDNSYLKVLTQVRDIANVF